jgi:hypothetical protein
MSEMSALLPIFALTNALVALLSSIKYCVNSALLTNASRTDEGTINHDPPHCIRGFAYRGHFHR